MNEKTKEDYLRAIYHHQEEKKQDRISSIDICRYLNLSKSTVSEMLNKLMKEGLIQKSDYTKIRLTKKGFAESIEVTKKHRIIEVFLSKILKINPEAIHEEAHKLEHAFGSESICSIAKMIKDEKACPHGKPIPSSMLHY